MGDVAFDLPEDIIPRVHHARSLPGRPLEQRMVPWPNIGALLTERALEAPERPYLTFYDEEGRAAEMTYRVFSEDARRVAALLAASLGLKRGDRIVTLMGNDPRTVLLYFGAWLLGVTVVPINSGEDDDRIAYILDNSEARAAFVLSDHVDRCDAIRPGLRTVEHYIQVGGDLKPGYISLKSALDATAPMDPLPDVPVDTECLIVYTSGTTGAPKGVVLDQYNLLVDALSIADWHAFGPDDRAMCVLPIHHVNGTVVTLMTPLVTGGSVVLNNRFKARAFWKTLADERCTWCSVVPTVLAFLCEANEDLSIYDLSRFRHIICGAGPLTTEVARRFDEAFGIRVVHGYGLSETTCYSCFLPIDLGPDTYHHWMQECGFPSIGCPISANEMAIHDPKGNPLSEDQRGEIVIRGHNVMRCYYRRPDANRDTFAHGWFRSGDEGFYRRGADGQTYYFITGRIKELIIRGGINYSPFDIDEVLNSIPEVKAAMAVGFENRFYGEEIGAYVQRENGASLSEEDVLRACRDRLPFAKSPKVVVFGEDFPVTSTGKYQRNRLKDRFAAWKDTEFRKPPVRDRAAGAAGSGRDR